MNREPIITSLLDQDLYKMSMQKFVLHKFPSVSTKWKYKCRSKGIKLAPFVDEVREEIYSMEKLAFEKEEIEFLRDRPYLSGDYTDFLRLYRPFPKDYIRVSASGDDLDIEADGPWLQVMPFEVPVLGIVSEVYNRNVYPNMDLTKAREILLKNTDLVNKNYLKWSCFGTRRRSSKAWQDEVTKHYSEHMRGNFNGTSNVFLAKKYNLTPIGTMAHEIFMVMQALFRLSESQKVALENWVQEYRGDLGIALTDIFGVDFFIKDFDLYFAKLFEGVRHDSGDPHIWCEKIIQMYRNLRIDPLNKTAVFTDGLTFEKAVDLKNDFNQRIRCAFGIGTNSTNDMGPDYPAIQHVMKIVSANGKPVAKVSDSPGKGMCESPEYEDYVRYTIKQRLGA